MDIKSLLFKKKKKLREEKISNPKIIINNWNSFVLSIDLNKKSNLYINDSKQEVVINKQLFEAFIKDKSFYAKFGILSFLKFP